MVRMLLINIIYLYCKIARPDLLINIIYLYGNKTRPELLINIIYLYGKKASQAKFCKWVLIFILYSPCHLVPSSRSRPLVTSMTILLHRTDGRDLSRVHQLSQGNLRHRQKHTHPTHSRPTSSSASLPHYKHIVDFSISNFHIMWAEIRKFIYYGQSI